MGIRGIGPKHRLAEVARIHDKYPDRIRVIVERVEMSDIPDIDKKKQVILRARNLKQLANFIRSSRFCQDLMDQLVLKRSG
ncbi:hypothetical protein Dimus_029340 [Dionaea muscipula]